MIKFENFSFQYFSQKTATLKNINLAIYPGEKILIVGPSGSGKSTLGNCLNGLIPFAYKGKISGSLKIKGQETKNQNIFSLSKNIGTVLQDSDGQFVGLSVGEDIAFALENENVGQDIMKQQVRKVAAMVDMDRLLESSPFELSGGQKQRVSLAGVMVDDVDILLFDEPLANLDPATGKTAIELIDDIHKQSNKTIIIIEHRLEDVLHRDVDRIILVDDGQIVVDDKAENILASSILKEHGIREPLYITALKYAGVDIKPSMKPAHIETLDVSDCAQKVRDWFIENKAQLIENNNEPMLELEHIKFRYDNTREIIKDISFMIRKGEMVSIIGRNGAGKSTLSKLILGFEKVDEGKIICDGHDLVEDSIMERGRQVGVVLQNPNQMLSKPLIYDEIALGLRNQGLSEDEIRERVENVMKICGLYEFRKWPISALSYGQKKRVSIACILVLNPKVLILDEPTAGQDFAHYSEIMEFLKQLNDNGQTIVLITHDMHLMLEYTPRAIALNDGKIVKDGSSAEILCSKELCEKANLKETSLMQLANKCGIDSPTDYVTAFIEYERKELR
ncbi:MAG: ABC transporter ATP-binding protein [Erysipelotrichales bacterium]|nr:ABC transporter ATP-binding protein [Erysipelotrichales bacterium]